MLSATALRTMRAALNWSMRDLSIAAGVALGTVLKIEQDGTVTKAVERRVRAAFRARGVSTKLEEGNVIIRIGRPPSTVMSAVPPDLLGLAFVSFRRRADGTHRVLFEVPARLRPPGWPSTRPLPRTFPRRGDLSCSLEVAAIKRDARDFAQELAAQRSLCHSAVAAPEKA